MTLAGRASCGCLYRSAGGYRELADPKTGVLEVIKRFFHSKNFENKLRLTYFKIYSCIPVSQPQGQVSFTQNVGKVLDM